MCKISSSFLFSVKLKLTDLFLHLAADIAKDEAQ